ncbi:MAG TPA: hypothetical protein VH661_01680 [Candidatus Dormibacteraeota bacterium]|jgi:hypothetical protein|nr:hypothetical protein [Candidatus Dormibacteraeota bacterium]
MPSRTALPVSTASARLRRLQQRLPLLSVPALLQVREAVEQALARERVGSRDVDVVLEAAGGD